MRIRQICVPSSYGAYERAGDCHDDNGHTNNYVIIVMIFHEGEVVDSITVLMRISKRVWQSRTNAVEQ